MENEKLSSAFIQKYDPLSDSFVVVENEGQNELNQKRRRFEPFSFFRRNKTLQEENITPRQNEVIAPVQNEQPQMDERTVIPQRPVEQVPPQRPAPQPVNQSVRLSIDAYNKLRILNSLYHNLLEIDRNNEEEYNDLINETTIMQSTMLSIYQTLSGSNNIPPQNQSMPETTGLRCRDLSTTENFLQNTTSTVLALQRAVNVTNINRQLSIISLTLLSQKNRLNALQTGCNIN